MFPSIQLENYKISLENFTRNILNHRFFSEIKNADHPVLSMLTDQLTRPNISEALSIISAQLSLIKKMQDSKGTPATDAPSENEKIKNKSGRKKISAPFSQISARNIETNTLRRFSTVKKEKSKEDKEKEIENEEEEELCIPKENMKSSPVNSSDESSSFEESDEDETEVEFKIRTYTFFPISRPANKSIQFGFKL